MARPIKSKKEKEKSDPLIGSWVNGDEYETEVEYIIRRAANGYVVRAVDRFDGEEGRVYGVNYDDNKSTLSFEVYWESTGRFVKARVMAISQNRVSYTFTYTENQMWFRKETEPTRKNK